MFVSLNSPKISIFVNIQIKWTSETSDGRTSHCKVRRRQMYGRMVMFMWEKSLSSCVRKIKISHSLSLPKINDSDNCNNHKRGYLVFTMRTTQQSQCNRRCAADSRMAVRGRVDGGAETERTRSMILSQSVTRMSDHRIHTHTHTHSPRRTHTKSNHKLCRCVEAVGDERRNFTFHKSTHHSPMQRQPSNCVKALHRNKRCASAQCWAERRRQHRLRTHLIHAVCDCFHRVDVGIISAAVCHRLVIV